MTDGETGRGREIAGGRENPAGTPETGEGGHEAREEAHPDGRKGLENERGRRETADERADRQWQDLMQEIRVVQTGVQILLGFLLTVVFTPGSRVSVRPTRGSTS